MEMELVLELLPLAIATAAIVTIILAGLEFRKKNKLTRIEMYLKMRDYYARDKNLKKVCSALDGSKKKVKKLTHRQKRQFLGTMESVALLVNSKVINKYVAMYMVGYYVIAAYECDDFWVKGKLEKTEPIWALFTSFYEQNRRLRVKFDSNTSYLIKKKLNFKSYLRVN